MTYNVFSGTLNLTQSTITQSRGGAAAELILFNNRSHITSWYSDCFCSHYRLQYILMTFLFVVFTRYVITPLLLSFSHGALYFSIFRTGTHLWSLEKYRWRSAALKILEVAKRHSGALHLTLITDDDGLVVTAQYTVWGLDVWPHGNLTLQMYAVMCIWLPFLVPIIPSTICIPIPIPTTFPCENEKREFSFPTQSLTHPLVDEHLNNLLTQHAVITTQD